MRRVLVFLNNLAGDTGCAMLLLHHLHERGQGAPDRRLSIDAFRGSSHIVSDRRRSASVIGLSVVQTGPQPDRDGPRRLEVVKTNLARYPEPLGLEPCSPDAGGVVLRYHPEAPIPYRRPTDVDECAAWLVDTLRERGTPIRPHGLIELAARCGYSERTVYRARRRLGDRIADAGGRHGPRNKWVLSGRA